MERILKEIYAMSIKTSNSTRKTNRLNILHGTVAYDLASKLDLNIYDIFVNSNIVKEIPVENRRELKIKGKIYNKNSDITILKNGKILASIAIKFVFSNYAQNANNYLEQSIAETYNAQSNKIDFYNLLFFRKDFPYFKTGKIEILKTESFNRTNFLKYKKWCDLSGISVPKITSINIIDYHEKKIILKHKNIGKEFNYEKYSYDSLLNLGDPDIYDANTFFNQKSNVVSYDEFISGIVLNILKK